MSSAEQLAYLALDAERRERMLNTMLSSIGDLTYTADCDGKVLYANEPTLSLWGRTLEEAKGCTVHDLGYPAELADRIQAQIRCVFDTGARVTGETPFTGADGICRVFEYIFSPAFAPDGSVEFMVGCSRDITARKRSEEAMRESEADFRTLATAMPQIVWSATDSGEIVYLNPKWCEYTGRSLADSLGDGWIEAVHAQDRDAVLCARDAGFAGDHDFSVEVRLAGGDGSYRWWLYRGAPVPDAGGHAVKWIGTCTDIDELKTAGIEIERANRELQRQRSELRALFDLVPAMVWFEDLEGRILQINQRAAAGSGVAVQHVVGRHVSELYPDIGEDYAAEDQEICQSGRPLLNKLEKVKGPGGGDIWLQSDKVPYRDEAGNVIGIVVMKQDVSERVRADETMQEMNAKLEERVRKRTSELALARDAANRANAAKSSFLAMMSHEIRTPITGLLGLLELLELTSLNEQQRSTLAIASESGLALKQIIDDILDFSKIEAQSLELHPRPWNIRKVVENVAGLHQANAIAKGLEVAVSFDPQVSRFLEFDQTRLSQILNNFLSNAIKFTEQGSVRLRVSLSLRGKRHDELELCVVDTGVGIPEKVKQRLFEPFAQGPAVSGSPVSGTGLGLFISKRLAQLMGGTISMDSHLGKGTTFTLRVVFKRCAGRVAAKQGDGPRERLHAIAAARTAAPPVGQAVAEGHLILVVDDHPINRMVLLRQVAVLGYAAEAVSNGDQALEAWQTGRFGAIITDCNMPGMSGFDVARAIRLREPAQGRRIPIIGCTANALASARTECLDAGMDDALTKPVSLEVLCAKLDRWLPLAKEEVSCATPAVTSTGSEVFDLSVLNVISSVLPGGRKQVLAEFMRSNEADAVFLRDALTQGQYASAADLAHRLCGAASMLGAARLAAKARDLQLAASSGRSRRMQGAMAALQAELHAVHDWISAQD